MSSVWIIPEVYKWLIEDHQIWTKDIFLDRNVWFLTVHPSASYFTTTMQFDTFWVDVNEQFPCSD